MADRVDKDDTGRDTQSEEGSAGADEQSARQGSADQGGAAGSPGIPRWRQIEIMHERAQLRKLLDDFDLNFEELEVEVFGSEAERDVFYRHLGEFDEEEIEIEDDDEDDDYEDEEYDDLEE